MPRSAPKPSPAMATGSTSPNRSARLFAVALLASTALAAAEGAAVADTASAGAGDARAALHLFVEPAAGQAVVVVTPSVSARLSVARGIAVAVDAGSDVVTGATPRTYGRPDVVSAATPFSELRLSVGARVEAERGPIGATLGYRYGTEHDYRSHVALASARAALLRDALVLAATFAHDFDRVCDLDNGGLPSTLRQPLGTSAGCFSGAAGLTEEPVAIDALELGATVAATPRLLVGAVGAWQHLDGFQSNPYRAVRLLGGAVTAQESHPRLRDRLSLTLRARLALDHPRGALGLDARLYQDTWELRAVTVEASWEGALGASERTRLRVRARGHLQSGASFYRDAGDADSYERAGPVGPYFTGDRELAPLADVLVGARLAHERRRAAGRRLARLFERLDVGASVDLLKVIALTPEPPSAPRMRGVVDALLVGLSASGAF